jgi:hypothetical protein
MGELKQPENVFPTQMTVSAAPRMRAALLLAIAADITQMVAFPLFMAGAASPADDVIDLCMAGVLSYLLGWHWEFLPSFAGKLVPGVDLVPLWTLAVGNVYRKSKHKVNEPEVAGRPQSSLEGGPKGR